MGRVGFGYRTVLSTLLKPRKPWLVSEADAARDRREWERAAVLYEMYLARHPLKWRARVQLGHVLKESGRLEAAEAAYRRALESAPVDGDLNFHLGHLLQQMGRLEEAQDHIERALHGRTGAAQRGRGGIGPVESDDLCRAMVEALPRATPVEGTFYDVTDIVIYFQNHVRVTGIQRVVVEFFKKFKAVRSDARFLSLHPYDLPLMLDPERLDRICAALDDPDVTLPGLTAMVREMIKVTQPVAIAPGSVVVILGAFWIFPQALPIFFRLRQSGVKIGVYIYDLIPYSHPEFCVSTNITDFVYNFVYLVYSSDFILTISERTRLDVTGFLAEIGVEKPVEVVPLAHELKLSVDPIDEPAWLERAGLTEDFVLCVGSIEVRKNHMLLFHLWRRLHRLHGDALPKLVFAGRQGWLVENLLTQLEATRYVGGRIVILRETSNAELSALYKACLFTVYPSFVEGWGLPVGESLVFGKPCAASGASSIPEVGGDLVEYFDPHCLPEAETVITRLLFDPEHRARQTARIAREFRPRAWADCAAAFDAAVRRLTAQVDFRDPARAAARLQPERLYRLGKRWIDYTDPATLDERRVELVLGEGWHPVEQWGVWAAHPQAEAILGLDGTTDAAIVCFAVCRPPSNPRMEIMIEPCGDPAASAREAEAHPTPQTGPGFVAARVTPDPGGVVRLFLRSVLVGPLSPLPGGDPRSLRAGLLGVGWCAADDTEAWARLRARMEVARS
ncbi:glycosyltransferase family 1 protein [Rubrimonas sp.]|uniref:glycosyltransferase family 1 protein n=1 Tax=Rubrimonas sp. TaxID=2036015 RepID=UPI002FDCF3F8